MPSVRSTYRVAIVCSHPIQYLAPWFRDLAQHPRLDVTVLYGHDHGLTARHDPEFGQAVKWNIDLTGGYRWQLLANHAPRPGVGRFFGIVNPGLVGLLTPQSFDAVLIQGWNYALYPMALVAARLHGLPVLLRCESVRPSEQKETLQPLGTRLKRELVRCYVSSCAAGLAVSAGNRRLLLHYGLPAQRIFSSPYAVDAQRFALPPEPRASARRLWRQRLGVAESVPLLLFVGKLIPVKAPELLLHAFAALRRRGVSAHLCFCGDGELHAALLEQRQRLGLGEADVSLPGFVNQAELPELYAAADALVLPSQQETFGIVIPEAMHAGLPVVVSDGVGCAEDLVIPGVTGLRFPVGSADELARCLAELCAGPQAAERRQTLADRAREWAASWTYTAATRGLIQALDSLDLA